jgi:DNA-binding response OmpR family regulator
MSLKKKILIIEDEYPLLRALKIKLEENGLEVLSAKNGKEGLETALKDHPDLILLDIVMPIMDGMSMLIKLREEEWGKSVPVIILTNLGETEKIAESIEKNAFDYLIKTDWTLEDIVKKVKERLEI